MSATQAVMSAIAFALALAGPDPQAEMKATFSWSTALAPGVGRRVYRPSASSQSTVVQ